MGALRMLEGAASSISAQAESPLAEAAQLLALVLLHSPQGGGGGGAPQASVFRRALRASVETARAGGTEADPESGEAGGGGGGSESCAVAWPALLASLASSLASGSDSAALLLYTTLHDCPCAMEAALGVGEAKSSTPAKPAALPLLHSLIHRLGSAPARPEQPTPDAALPLTTLLLLTQEARFASALREQPLLRAPAWLPEARGCRIGASSLLLISLLRRLVRCMRASASVPLR